MQQDTVPHHIGHNMVFMLPEKPEILTSTVAMTAFEDAKKQCQDFMAVRAEIMNDQLLSERGKAEKLQPHIDGLQNLLGFHSETLAAFKDHLERLDAELLAVAKPVTPFEISQEKEIREWWHTLDNHARLAVLSDFRDHPEKFTAVMNALQNSPLPVELKAHEAELVRKTHREVRRLERPDLAIRQDEGKVSLAWAERGFAHLKGIMSRQPGFSRDETLRFHAEKGNKERLVALGFGSIEIEQAMRQAAAKRQPRS